MHPDPGPFWRALPPPDSGRIIDRRVGRFRRPHCLVCSRSCRGYRGPLRRALGRPPFTDGVELCIPCFDRFWSNRPVGAGEDLVVAAFGLATIELSVVFMDIGIQPRSRLPGGTDFRRYMVRAMGAIGAVTERHDGIGDQLIDTGGLVSMWIPGIAGRSHARKAIQAGQDLARAISNDKFLTTTMPGGVVVDTTTGLVAIVGGLGTSLEFHAAADATETAVVIADSTTPGEFVVTERAATAGGLRVDGGVRFTYESEEGDKAEDAYLIPAEPRLIWESD